MFPHSGSVSALLSMYNVFSSSLVLHQPAPLEIVHQLHKGNSIQLNALKTLIEPAIKVWVCLSEFIHILDTL